MTYRWLLKHSHKQIPSILFVTIANALYALTCVFFALLSREVIDHSTSHDKKTYIYILGLFLVILSMMILRSFSSLLSERVRVRLEIGYKNDVMCEFTKKQYHLISAYHSGELLNRLFNDAQVVCDGITSIIPSFVLMTFKIIFSMVILLYLCPSFAFFLFVGGITIILITSIFRNKLKSLHKKVQETQGVVRSLCQEATENLLILKVFFAEKKMLSKISIHQENYYKHQMKKRSISVFAGAGISFAFDFFYLLALVMGVKGLFLGTMTFGTLTAILQLVNQVQQPFSNLSGLLPRYYSMIGSVERIIEIESIPNEKTEPNIDVLSFYNEMNAIHISDLCFSYDRNIIIDQSSFIIHKGDFVSITGPSGVGKSTLFLLMLGAYLPSSGTITLECTNESRPIGTSTRSLFSYVPQGNLLFSGTLRENITFLNSTASDEEILQAVKTSCVSLFLDSLPEGLDTLIGEHGFGLSEGQVQRISIARALLSKAPILLLDEATSALDEATEYLLLKNISQLKNTTCFIVTHRKPAIQFCNRHLNLVGGTISEYIDCENQSYSV